MRGRSRPSAAPPHSTSSVHLVGPYPKALQGVRSECGRDRDVGGIATARDEDTSDAWDIVSWIERMPGTAEISLEPPGEIHRRWILRPADVTQIAGAIPRGNVHAPAKGDGEVGEVAADAPAFIEHLPGGLGGAGELVTEL